MAISLIQQPLQYHSSTNTNWWAFESNMRFAPRFAIKMDIKDGSSIYNSLLVPTSPNTYNVLDIKNIMKDYVLPDFNCFITSPTASTCVRSYNISAQETFEGLWVFATSSAGTIGTVSVVNNTTLTSIEVPTSVEQVEFLGGPINSNVNQIYVIDYATASNGFVNRLTLSQNQDTFIPVTASVGANSPGYLILNDYTVFSYGATYSTDVKRAILANIDYLDYNISNNFTGYVMPGAQFLTKCPNTLEIQKGEVATLSYLQSLTQSASQMYVVDNLGLTYSKSIPSSLTQSVRIDIPTGTQNLNINANATSYCVTLRNSSTQSNYASATFTFDGSEGWILGSAYDITWTGYTFSIPENGGEWGTAYDLFTEVISESFYSEPSNSNVNSNYDIEFLEEEGLSFTFRIVAKATGTSYNFTSINIISEDAGKIEFTSSTSGATTTVFTNVSETICYDIRCLNSWSDSVRLTWLNTFGGIDYYTFRFTEQEGIRANRNNFDKNLNYGFDRQSRGISTYRMDYYNEYTVVSNLVDDETSEWLKELFISTEVYWIRNGELIPITLTSDSYNYSVGFASNEVRVTFRLARTNRK